MNKKELEVQSFWDNYPCGDSQVGGIEKFQNDYEKFFSEYDKLRYKNESHILKLIDDIDWKDKNILEIGLGQGADSEQIIKRGGIWSGIDLTNESIKRTQTRLSLRKLPFKVLKQGDVLSLPFKDNSFDIVYSFGVLHHVPNIEKAQKEIHRVLKPNGELIVMLYAKYSLNYLISISILRRLGLILLYLKGSSSTEIYSQHILNAKKIGLFKYIKMSNFIHKNTDGPLNPYSKVYGLKEVRKCFNLFEIKKSYKQFLHAPPIFYNTNLPFLAKQLGWHLLVFLKPI